MPSDLAFKLIVTAGPDKGQEFLLGAGSSCVGRDGSNAVVLSDPTISRHHFDVRVEDGAARILDNRSRNLTLVNGRPVSQEPLRAGDRISCGDTELLILHHRISGDSRAPAAGTTVGVARRGKDALVLGIVGSSESTRKLVATLERMAPMDTPVLLEGESGTGKDLAAMAIHYGSQRRGKPLVCLNAAAIPEQLLESELFGHCRGAFTGANADRPGHFELADGGTLFLDEVAELSAAGQAKLLRVLEDGRFMRVGENRERRADVRLIAATNRDLEQTVADGHFRQDLYFRLAVLTVTLPPLRKRAGDIAELVPHFLQRFSGEAGRRVAEVEPEALKRLERYTWPGNIRQLKNVIRGALVLGEGPTLRLDDLPELRHEETEPSSDDSSGKYLTIQEVERDQIRKVLHHTGGNKTKAAEILGISRNTLYEKLKGMD